jgi:D-glycero-alpha-D-manno-heptose-7-phosphate kinase
LITTRSPFRISFVGGGSDIEDFYRSHSGAVISTSINKYMYISSHPFFENDKIRVKYSKTETALSANELNHPIFREALNYFNVPTGLELSSIADIPAGTGMGSSSSFTVCLLHNIFTVLNKEITKEKLAREACQVEIGLLKEPIGKQDQYAAAFGGLNLFEFKSDGHVNVIHLNLAAEIYENFEENLILFYTGHSRNASEVLKEQKKNMFRKESIEILKEMVQLVYHFKDSLLKGELDMIGKLLHHNWMLKQKLASGITNSFVDSIYSKALKNGALGGKLLGAGGGGFLLFYCPKLFQNRLIESLRPLRYFPFKFEREGSKLIYASESKPCLT